MSAEIAGRVRFELLVEYDPTVYALHLGTPVDRDLATRVAVAVRDGLEDGRIEVPRGTRLRVTDWWVG